MKEILIFIDVDGVLNTQHTYERFIKSGESSEHNNHCLENELIDNLKELLDYMNISKKLVLSSTWRYNRLMTNALVDVLKKRGIKKWVASTGSGMTKRCYEIRRFVEAYKINNSNFGIIILDDAKIEDANLQKYHIHTNWNGGFDKERLTKAKKMVNHYQESAFRQNN